MRLFSRVVLMKMEEEKLMGSQIKLTLNYGGKI